MAGHLATKTYVTESQMFYNRKTSNGARYKFLKLHAEETPQTSSIVEVFQGGKHQRLAVVESTSEDGTLIWLAAYGADTRALFHRDELSTTTWTST